jgi:hypothetical protein
VANAISFTAADLWPTNSGTNGCPTTFKTLSFTSPGGQGDALDKLVDSTVGGQVEFWIEDASFTSWNLKVDWNFSDQNNEVDYPHPILAAMLLIGLTDKVIYASKLVYFKRDPLLYPGFDFYRNNIL